MKRRLPWVIMLLIVMLLAGCWQPVSSMTEKAEPQATVPVVTDPSETTETTPAGESTPEPQAAFPNTPIWHLSHELTGTIHLDQIGYRPADRKIAVIENYSGPFRVIHADNDELVLEGDTSTRSPVDPSTGQTLSTADFSRLDTTGRYYLLLPEVGRSWPFEIADSVYRDVADSLFRFLYLQRCGIELDETIAGVHAHPACHQDAPVLYENQEIAVNLSGGWHDAGDYGRYSVPTAKTIADLLLTHQFFPDAYADQSGIPESGDSLPDLLNEAKIGLSFLMQMQAEDGGIHHKVSTTAFPGNLAPQSDRMQQYILPVSSPATASGAAVLAMAGRLYADTDPLFASSATAAARLAWRWLETHPQAVPFHNPSGVVTGEYGDLADQDERAWAAAELFTLTGEPGFREAFDRWSADMGADRFGFGWQSVGGYAAISRLMNGSGDAAANSDLRSAFLDEADRLAEFSRQDGHLAILSVDDYGWGSNMTLLNRAMHLILAGRLSGQGEWDEIALDQLHYLFGRNGLGQVYLTGFGSQPVRYPHHRPSLALLQHAPVPGMVAGGPNIHREDPAAEILIKEGSPPALAYIDQSSTYSTNEVTIYWNSPAIFVIAAFTDEVRLETNQ